MITDVQFVRKISLRIGKRLIRSLLICVNLTYSYAKSLLRLCLKMFSYQYLFYRVIFNETGQLIKQTRSSMERKV